MKNLKGKTYKDLYLDYLNNFLTVEAFADYYGITISQANTAINIGRIQHTGNDTVADFLINNV